MAHLSSIGAGLFTDLSVAMPNSPPTFANLDTDAEFHALFASMIESNSGTGETVTPGTKAANTFVRIKNVREFPAMGTPPNIVNVPVYGQKSSQQVQGQSDSPNMEVTVNFVAKDWCSGSLLGNAIGDGNQYVFRFALLNSQPGSTYNSTAGASGLGAVQNTVYYFIGKLEAMVVNPQLTDANTATITISIQSAIFGAYTVAGA